MGVVEARPDRAEVVETMIERLGRNRHAEIGRIGERRQPPPSGLVDPKNHPLCSGPLIARQARMRRS
jgi:hypothetical protein